MRTLLALLLSLGLALAQGEGVWARNCAQCHGEKGQGVRGFPSLEGVKPLLSTPEGRRYLVLVVLYGRKGEVGLMPGFAQLKDEEVAQVLNHLLALLKLQAPPFTPEEVRKERGLNLTPDRVRRP